MTTTPADELLERVVANVGSWTAARRQAHGFDLMVGDPDHLRRLRRAHARTVLVSESLLSELAAAHQTIVLMKGLEAGHLYPATLQRPFRDLDLLVPDAHELWRGYLERGYRPNPRRRADIDHHHLPALSAPSGVVGVELHLRPNLPAWASVPTDLLFATAEPSRTGIPGIQRPRDDLHALLMALHCWKGGFTRLRDLLDALLFASVSSERPVERTAAELGLSAFWRWTVRFADAELLGRPSRVTRAAARAVLPRHDGLVDRRRARLLAPFLVANPARVLRGHVAEYRLGREARHPAPSGSEDGAVRISRPAR